MLSVLKWAVLSLALSVSADRPDTESPLASGEWQLVLISSAGDTLRWEHPDEPVTIRFGTVPVEDATIGQGFWFAGMSSCNGFKGTYLPDDDSLGVNTVIATAMLCTSEDAMQVEAALFSGLREKSTFVVNRDELVISSERKVIVLRRRD
jgi:heat shock protein HslJ